MSIQLTVMSLDFDSTGAPTTTVINKKVITLGRSKDNDVVLDRPEVSDIHARLRVDPTTEGDDPALYITDLGSSNGTLVENNSLKSDIEVKMLPNERIIIGNYLIKPTVVKEGIESEIEESQQTRLAWSFTDVESSSYSSGTEHKTNGVNGHAAVDEATPYAEDLHAKQVETRQVEAKHSEPEHSETAHLETALLGTSAIIVPKTAKAQSECAAEGAGAVTILLDGEEIQELDFVATELFTVHGTVTHKGSPLADVEVSAGSLGSVTTGADGTYHYSDVPEGTEYAIEAKKPGYIFDCSAAKGTVSSDVVRTIAATELFPITITVQHKGLPLSAVALDAGSLGSHRTDAQGNFTINEVPEGTSYRLTLSKDKFICEPAEISGVVGDGPVTLSSYARELFDISGRVVHRGIPLAGVTVDGGKLGSMVTDADGRYRFQNVPEGEQYTLRVSKQKFRIRRS